MDDSVSCNGLNGPVQQLARIATGEAGVRQFIDLGTGIPTSPNVHEVARRIHPDARVVYVDHDPIVMAHNRALRARPKGVVAIGGDIRRPQEILDHPDVRELIDFDRPVGVLCLAVLHFVSDEEDPYGVLAALRARMAPGSHLVMSTTSSEGFSEDEVEEITASYTGVTSGLTLRSRARIERFFDGLELLKPGVVDIFKWRADESLVEGGKLLAGVARKNA
ncbi:SAM-dependent methyltransferase [Actinoallomurus sp. NPDC050550]|uniref:SAM-dependent methyltransferase n=1 Tax=Actinoallomurus sp. NPDC050550 TaxID=3154937 RepID=UPI00340855C0